MRSYFRSFSATCSCPSATTILNCGFSSGRRKWWRAAAMTSGSISTTVSFAAGRCRYRNRVIDAAPNPICSTRAGHSGPPRNRSGAIRSRVYSSSSDQGREMRIAPWIHGEPKCRKRTPRSSLISIDIGAGTARLGACPPLQERRDLVRARKPELGQGLARLLAHEHAEAARPDRAEGILVGEVVAEIGADRVRAGLQGGAHRVALVVPERSNLETAVEMEKGKTVACEGLPRFERRGVDAGRLRRAQPAPMQCDAGDLGLEARAGTQERLHERARARELPAHRVRRGASLDPAGAGALPAVRGPGLGVGQHRERRPQVLE